jgi:RNA polymerase sigma-70 factor, ECF subfamily
MMANEPTTTTKSGQSHHRLTDSCARPDEDALVAAAQAGLPEAVGELLVRHKTALYRAARRFATSHEDAEDLVQDAMLRAYVNLHNFRNECRFGTWLTAIVNNAALSAKRRKRNVYLISLEGTHAGQTGLNRWDLPDARRNPEEEAMQKELLTLLRGALLRQSRTHQLILKRRLFDDAPITEAASSLGLTVASAKSSLFRARRRLSESFERRGLVQRRKLSTLSGNEITPKSEQI